MSYKILLLIALILSVGILTGAEKYAVLITGDFADDQGNFNGSWAVANGLSSQSPMEEFWNDTFLMWEMLLEKGYDDENIFVLYADGTDCDETYIIEGGRYIPDIHDFEYLTDYSASLANVEMVLEGLAFGNAQQDIPQLQDDDFLTIWTFGHGAVHNDHNWLSLYNGNEISDEDFGDLIAQINCQKKVIFMQQCYAGGFIPYLEADDTIILTTTNENMHAFREDATYYDGITPGTSTPGTPYTADERDVWAGHTYRHGEFNLHLLNAVKMETPDYNDLYETSYTNFHLDDVDVNGDALTSIEEAKNWISDFNSRQALQPSGHYDDPQWSDEGEIGEVTSLDFPTIYHNFTTQSELTIKGISCISGYFLTGGSDDYDVTLHQGSELYLINDAVMWIGHNSWFGASLIIEDNCKIYGEDDALITLQGYLEVGENVEFISLSNDLWTGLTMTGEFVDQLVSFDDVHFSNFKIISDHRDVEITNCTFTGSELDLNENVIISYSDFDDTFINIWNNGENEDRILVNNCDISNSSVEALLITNYPSFKLDNNLITDCRKGIYIFESGYGDAQLISNNTIRDCSNGSGIYLYHSYANITGSNVIKDNQNGISVVHNSNFSMIGSEDYPLQIVRHNDEDEIYFTYDSKPSDFYYNQIYDDNHNDSYVYCDDVPLFYELVDISNNNWGASFNPALDLYPTNLYTYLPIWDPGSPRSPDGNEAKQVYLAGKSYEENGDYVSAELSYKQVISVYPESDFSLVAAKALFALESKSEGDFQDLKNYYETEPNMQFNDNSIKLAEYLVAFCNIKLEDFSPAISYFEDVILNPPSFADSVFAVIDAGYTYLLMQGNGNRGCMGTMPELIPESKEDFAQNRDELLDLLADRNISDEENLIRSTASLQDNYPNPFNPTTSISFSIPNENKVDLTIFNIKGQKVKTLISAELNKGSHTVVWNGVDDSGKIVSSGVYFYKLSVGGKSKAVKKCLMLK